MSFSKALIHFSVFYRFDVYWVTENDVEAVLITDLSHIAYRANYEEIFTSAGYVMYCQSWLSFNVSV